MFYVYHYRLPVVKETCFAELNWDKHVEDIDYLVNTHKEHRNTVSNVDCKCNAPVNMVVFTHKYCLVYQPIVYGV